jgi:hypothetical protein
MKFKKWKAFRIAFLVLLVSGIWDQAWALQQRNMISYLRGPYKIYHEVSSRSICAYFPFGDSFYHCYKYLGFGVMFERLIMKI